MDNRSKIYKKSCITTNDTFHYFINWIESDSVVLDVGCACGDLGLFLKKTKSCSIYGLEYNEESISIAKSKNVYNDICQVDLNCFEESNFINFYNKFDYIVLGDILEHLINPNEVLSKLKKYLKDNGCFLISLPNISHGSIKIDLLLNQWNYTETGILDKTHLRFFTLNSIIKFFTDINLEIKDIDYTIRKVPYKEINIKNYKKLPLFIRYFIKKDPYSNVLQYIFKVQVSEADTQQISTKNTIICEKKHPRLKKTKNESKLKKLKIVLDSMSY